MRRKGFWILALVLALALAPLPMTHIAWAATYTVTNTNDSGLGSLRQAIIGANSHPGPDTINFNISGCGAVCTIQPNSALPSLSGGGTTIDGYTQPGAAAATDGTPATLVIEIDGTNAGGVNGLTIISAGNVIRGLAIYGFSGDGVRISGSSATGNTVSGNYIGTDASGTADPGNTWAGVWIGYGAQNNTIGGDTAGERNVISGNGGVGVEISDHSTKGNTVSGNYIGTDDTGMTRLGNGGAGVYISGGAQNNTIGGHTAGERNVISGNDLDGVDIEGDGTTGNTVSSNYIGTNASGTADLGNDYDGVWIAYGAQNNTIGGDAAGERNVISGNDLDGVGIEGGGTTGNTVSGNYIGTDASGTADLGNGYDGVWINYGAQNNTVGPGNVIAHNGWDGVEVDGSSTSGNTITQNSIFSNDMGIRLTDGANGGIAAPLIVTTSVGSLDIVGTACAGCTVEVFENGDTDGEGETYVGDTTANVSGAFTVTVICPSDPYLTATATDAISGTSEFSAVFTSTVTVTCTKVYLPIILKNY